MVSNGTRSGATGSVVPRATCNRLQRRRHAGDAVPVHGCTAATVELWRRTDRSGDLLVKDLLPGAGGAALSFFVVAGGKLLHQRGGRRGRRAPATAPPAARYGSKRSARRAFGTSGRGRRPHLFTRVSPTTGGEQDIWTSDGTAAGTPPLTDFVPQLATPTPVGRRYEPAGDTSTTASDPVHGVELWKSDGTPGAPSRSPTSSGKEPFFYELGRTWSRKKIGRPALFLTVQIDSGEQRWRFRLPGGTVQTW